MHIGRSLQFKLALSSTAPAITKYNIHKTFLTFVQRITIYSWLTMQIRDVEPLCTETGDGSKLEMGQSRGWDSKNRDNDSQTKHISLSYYVEQNDQFVLIL